jgi:hypothetical protein
MIKLIGLYILLYSISFLIHEYGHMAGAALQGVKSRIEYRPYNKIPSIITYPLTSIKYDKLFDISGGLVSGLILLIFYALIKNSNLIELKFSLISLTILQFSYSIYEMLYLRKLNFDKYMLYHYILYGIVIGFSFIYYVVIILN